MSRADHMDVAAYALGVLDPQDTERFEEHLATCWACAAELETMVPVVGLLSGIDGEAMAALEQTHTDPALLDRTLVAVRRDRRRTRVRQLLATAAAVVVFGGLSGVAAGMLGEKQRVFEDFIAAGEALIAGGWTSPEHLGIRGGSNGGRNSMSGRSWHRCQCRSTTMTPSGRCWRSWAERRVRCGSRPCRASPPATQAFPRTSRRQATIRVSRTRQLGRPSTGPSRSALSITSCAAPVSRGSCRPVQQGP